MALAAAIVLSPSRVAAGDLQETITTVQPKIVKIFGAGGVGRLESYQSGFLISEDGYILTARSYVLDSELIDVVLNDGSRYQADYVGHDPIREITLLKIDAAGLPHFDLDSSIELMAGERILTFSNLYAIAVGNESASVLHGTISAVTQLSARQGTIQIPYQGPAYVIDAMTNNPGAAGGAITDWHGNLVAIVGKELQTADGGLWLNFGIPISELRTSIDDIQSGRLIPRAQMDDERRVPEPITLHQLGILLVPNVVPNTPPYVDSVVPDSPSDHAGLRADDLILFIDDRLMTSRDAVVEELEFHHRDDPLSITVQRGSEVVSITIHQRRAEQTP